MTAASGRIAGSEMVTILQAIYPSFRIIDMSFPELDFFWLHDDTVSVLNPGSAETTDELEFLSRFRQNGGHEPILRLADLPATLSASQSRPRKTDILACRASGCATLAQGLEQARQDITVLVHGGEDAAPLLKIGYFPWLAIRFIRPHAAVRMQLLSRHEPAPDTVANILAAAQVFAIDIRVKPHPKARAGSLITIMLPAEGFRPATACFTPHRLLHDGSRRSEGNAKYAWLWVGAERHIRFLFGEIPEQFGHVRLIVPNAHGTANLQSAKLLLNGKVVAPQVEIWDEGAGAVGTDFPPGTEVVGFSVPEITRLDDGTQLAACIDRIEFRA